MGESGDETEHAAGEFRFTRELGLTHAEFHRSLPPAIAHHPHSVDGHRVLIDYGDRSVIIELGPQQHRRIASLQLPYVEVTFVFVEFTTPDREAFIERFERYFRRGGG